MNCNTFLTELRGFASLLIVGNGHNIWSGIADFTLWYCKGTFRFFSVMSVGSAGQVSLYQSLVPSKRPTSVCSVGTRDLLPRWNQKVNNTLVIVR